MLKDILHCIVAGFEHSGTTLMTDLLRQHPTLDSGFEGGLLLKESPQEFLNFEPYFGNLRSTWKLTDSDMARICRSQNFEIAYTRMRKFSPVITDKSKKLFDKTPRYMQKMSEILSRNHDIPAIIMIRDPRAVMWSSYKRAAVRRAGLSVETWQHEIYPITLKHTKSYAESALKALTMHPNRVLLVKYEDLARAPLSVLPSIFSHIGLDFSESFLNFKPKYNLTYSNKIEDKYSFEYMKGFSEATADLIKSNFKEFPVLFTD